MKLTPNQARVLVDLWMGVGPSPSFYRLFGSVQEAALRLARGPTRIVRQRRPRSADFSLTDRGVRLVRYLKDQGVDPWTEESNESCAAGIARLQIPDEVLEEPEEFITGCPRCGRDGELGCPSEDT